MCTSGKTAVLALLVMTAFGLTTTRLVGASEAASEKEKQQIPTKGEKKDEGGECSFTGFWKHDVGDTIWHGLKTGARKIHHAFQGGSKEQDLQNDQKPKPEEKSQSAGKSGG